MSDTQTAEVALQSLLEHAVEVQAPSVYRNDGLDYDAFIDRLSACDADKALSFPLPVSVPFFNFGQSLRSAAMRRGINVSIRHIGEDVYVVRRSTSRRNRKASQRDAEIIEALRNGETQVAVAVKYSLSRQRVEQIEKKYFVAGISPANRHDSLLAFIAPYIASLGEKYCPICGDGDVSEKSTLCTACKLLVKHINRVRNFLSAWRDRGKAQALRQASYEIRKYNLKPEHLSGKKLEAQ